MRPIITIATILVFSLGSVGCHVAIADDCDHSAPREASLDVDGATRLVIDVGAGSLDVRGSEGLDRVRAEGTACASRAEYLDDIALSTDRRGDTLYLKAEYPRRVRGSASLDLEVELPSGLAVEIDDGSGSLTVRSVASLELEDGSGSIEVSDIDGDLDIDDGSGEIEVLGIGGSVFIDDGSGEIEVTGVGGSVRVSDGSGEIELRDVDGDVTIDDDGSGEIDIAGVGGSVVVEEDGSGSIRVRDVDGDLTVRRDGSGSIIVDGVRGRVTTPDD
ncbi:MAG: hypothetical protein PVG07_01895 [Acidobacteriota bacterium]